VLETVEIINYQGHEHSILEFDKGLNVIKGPTHSGKSSIWRALYWALQNRPLGEGFVSYFASKEDKTSVALEFDDGVVIRSRSKDDNIYDVNSKELKAVKSDIPDEVKEVTKLDEVNLHNQDDPYFLILDTPGNVARKLNESVGLDIIDETMSKVNGIIKRSQMKLKVIDEELFKLEGELESLYWIDKVTPKINRLTHKVDRLKVLRRETLSLRSHLIVITTCKNKVSKHELFLAVEKSYLTIKSKIEKYNKLKIEFGKLDTLVYEITYCQSSIKDINNRLRIEEAYTKLSHKVTRRKQLSSEIRQLKQLCKRMQKVEIDVNSANKHVTKLESKYNNLLKSTNACPLCGRAW
jgi:exonuclease SbcC